MHCGAGTRCIRCDTPCDIHRQCLVFPSDLLLDSNTPFLFFPLLSLLSSAQMGNVNAQGDFGSSPPGWHSRIVPAAAASAPRPPTSSSFLPHPPPAANSQSVGRVFLYIPPHRDTIGGVGGAVSHVHPTLVAPPGTSSEEVPTISFLFFFVRLMHAFVSFGSTHSVSANNRACDFYGCIILVCVCAYVSILHSAVLRVGRCRDRGTWRGREPQQRGRS